jgi:hypothetical protein
MYATLLVAGIVAYALVRDAGGTKEFLTLRDRVTIVRCL